MKFLSVSALYIYLCFTISIFIASLSFLVLLFVGRPAFDAASDWFIGGGLVTGIASMAVYPAVIRKLFPKISLGELIILTISVAIVTCILIFKEFSFTINSLLT